MKNDEGKPVRKPVEIRLEKLEAEDFPKVRPWMDPRIFRIFQAPVDDNQLARLLTDYKDGKPVSLGYRIVRVSDDRIVGLIHAIIDWNNRLAHIGQIVVGDPAHRGLGIGQRSLTQLLGVCFDELHLHRAQLFVDEDNAEAVVCYKKVGFQIEGLMREAARVGNRFISWYSMSILKDEWQKPRDGRVDLP